MPQYRVTGGPEGTAGLNYKGRRAEPGDVVDDLPRESIKWLREQGYISAVGKDDALEPEPADDAAAPPAADSAEAAIADPAPDPAPADEPAPDPEV